MEKIISINSAESLDHEEEVEMREGGSSDDEWEQQPEE
jgi:hypothetical protein